MTRRLLIGLLLITVLLQGITVAGAGALAASSAQHHCPDHPESGETCACCTGDQGMLGGCASLCASVAALSNTMPTVRASASFERLSFEACSLPSPPCIPLTPPPIS